MRIGRAIVDGRPEYGQVDGNEFHVLAGDPFSGDATTTKQSTQLSPGDLLSPVVPSKVLIILAGFREPGTPYHDGSPALTMKGLSADPTGDYAKIVYPTIGTGAPISVEAELAVVIGKTTSRVDASDAWDHIAGFTAMNDVSAMDFIKGKPEPDEDWVTALADRVGGLFAAKAFDTFCSIGPWLVTDVTKEQVHNGMTIETRVNGEKRGSGTTALYKHPVDQVVSRASYLMTLHPGDVISLGTPGNIKVDPGDEVEIDVEGIGVLHNSIVDRVASGASS